MTVSDYKSPKMARQRKSRKSMQQLDFYKTAQNHKKSEAETLLSDTSEEEDDDRPSGETTQLLIAHSPKK